MPEINAGDTAWILISAALVMFMTPGLALFYGGLVRAKNVLSTYMHSFFALGLITAVWFIAGYALAFGPDKGGFIGGGDFLFLDGVSSSAPGPDPGVGFNLSGATPHMAFMIFQLMFAIITPALISGAFAERVKFSGVITFFAFWSLLVYSPIAHWVWGGGWLFDKGVLDFAGGTVVHINAGIAALVFCIYCGKRRGWPRDVAPPHNVPMVVLGASILWFGWFGFNGGSALGIGGVGEGSFENAGMAVSAFSVTHMGAAAAMLGWALVERLKHGKITAVGVATGAVAGLVAITPASGFVRPWSAMVIGFVAAIVCFFAINMKYKLGYDDSLDVVGVHLVGGVVGALLTGVFAEKAVNALGDDGLLFGNAVQLFDQFIGVAATILYSGIVSFILIWIVDKVVGIRVSEDEESTGLDLTQHGEAGYGTGDTAASIGHTAVGTPSPPAEPR